MQTTSSFKHWIQQHNPRKNWKFDSPYELEEQLREHIKNGGSIDIISVFSSMHYRGDSSLTKDELNEFIKARKSRGSIDLDCLLDDIEND